MSVNILYCEDVSKSSDVRVISAIVLPGCVVRPIRCGKNFLDLALDLRLFSVTASLKELKKHSMMFGPVYLSGILCENYYLELSYKNLHKNLRTALGAIVLT